MAETPSGMLNAIGLQNPGIDRWLEQDYRGCCARGVPTIVSIAGKTVHEYRALAERLRGLAGMIADRGQHLLPERGGPRHRLRLPGDATYEAITAVARVAAVPVFAKLTPDVTDIAAIAPPRSRPGRPGSASSTRCWAWRSTPRRAGRSWPP